MRSPTGCALVVVMLAACGGDGRLASDSAGTGEPISFRRAREVDLTGDRQPERFVVVATGPSYDSLAVSLEIRSLEDSLLYTDSWDSGLYFRADERPQLADSAVEQRVRAQIDSVLGSAAFRPGGTELTTDERMNREGMHDAVRYDVAEDMWRRANNVPVDSSTPPERGRSGGAVCARQRERCASGVARRGAPGSSDVSILRREGRRLRPRVVRRGETLRHPVDGRTLSVTQ